MFSPTREYRHEPHQEPRSQSLWQRLQRVLASIVFCRQKWQVRHALQRHPGGAPGGLCARLQWICGRAAEVWGVRVRI